MLENLQAFREENNKKLNVQMLPSSEPHPKVKAPEDPLKKAQEMSTKHILWIYDTNQQQSKFSHRPTKLLTDKNYSNRTQT